MLQAQITLTILVCSPSQASNFLVALTMFMHSDGNNSAEPNACQTSGMGLIAVKRCVRINERL